MTILFAGSVRFRRNIPPHSAILLASDLRGTRDEYSRGPRLRRRRHRRPDPGKNRSSLLRPLLTRLSWPRGRPIQPCRHRRRNESERHAFGDGSKRHIGLGTKWRCWALTEGGRPFYDVQGAASHGSLSLLRRMIRALLHRRPRSRAVQRCCC